MIIPDLNILLYAIDKSSIYHRKAKAWLEETVNNGSDAHLAALALENDATLVTCDRDFLRFPGLKVHLLF